MTADSPRVLVAVISGGRPLMSHRHTSQFFSDLEQHGFPDIEWVVREDQAAEYELDDYPINTYPVEFSDEYSRTHWRHPEFQWEAGGFHGAFPGREWIMRQGRERGYDLVLQLDDNIISIGLHSSQTHRYRVTSPGVILNLMARIAMSTNVMMYGGQLDSVAIKKRALVLRPGYPYSMFFEKTGVGRLPYYGPFEDDVMHALEYALHPSGAVTAAISDCIRYSKNHTIKTGMRKHYNPTRGLELARRYPRNARLRQGPRSSSPNESEVGIRHYLNTKGFTPVRIIDKETYREAEGEIAALSAAAFQRFRETSWEIIRKRGGLEVPSDG